MNRLERALADVSRLFNARGVEWALVGGLAVSARAEPRATRDVDVAIKVASDTEAEQLLFALRGDGYELSAIVEQRTTKRLATARLQALGSGRARPPIVDLLFASSGIEPEIVDSADLLEVLPGLSLCVARIGHLIAMKVLARDDRRRPQDWDDLRALLGVATPADVRDAEVAMQLIHSRDAARGRDLLADFARLKLEIGG